MLVFHVLLTILVWPFQASSMITENDRAPLKRAPLQDLVTWDEHSILVRGERVMFYSGEFHPFRLPVPGLWLDIFQKIKAMGFSGVSFYTDWGLLEGKQGEVIVDGIFSLDEFFRAAKEAGIYLLARPGPYVNAELAAGGLPGWTLRLKAVIRSNDPGYLNITQTYVSTIGKIIADAQITNGGPVILVQPENEYSTYPGVRNFPNQMNKEYMAFVEQQLRDAGIVVPLVDNDNRVLGSFAPGTGVGAVDLYGIDAYPLRYDCGHPYNWPTDRFPQDWNIIHQQQSPSTPFSIVEFQGGAGDGWGGVGEDQCAILVNEEAVRVLYKNNYSFGATLFNIYMTYGGTNWGNMGYFGGYTSYDYGAAITEDRYIWREKYSETKLQANFLKVSDAYLTATPGNASNGSYASTDAITVTPLFGNNKTQTNFYVTRHADFTSTENTPYRLSVSTSLGNITIPQLGGTLSINGRDSKIHVADYDVGGTKLVYSTADVYTWAKSAGSRRTLILYGGAGETHEVALPASNSTPSVTEGSGVTIQQVGSSWVLQWQVQPARRVVQSGDLEILLLWRNDAYNYWALELPAAEPVGNYSSPSKSLVIARAGYLLRNAEVSGTVLKLNGDINATTDIEVISVPFSGITDLSFNGESLQSTVSDNGRLTATVNYDPPSLSSPTLSGWKYIDSLPELQPTYDDLLWTNCDLLSSKNPRNLTTLTDLYGSDYGYHAGSLLYRGAFTATGNETAFFINITGGYGFAHSVWLNSTLLGSWVGSGSNQYYAQTFNFSTPLRSGSPYVITTLIDHTGQDEEGPGTDAVKFPRGILDYALRGRNQADVTWKITGNFGGEDYPDKTRGPRNEGAMFAERQGYHLPDPPSGNWSERDPVQDGIARSGVGFYTTTFDLDVPLGYDIPISVVLNETSTNTNLPIGSNSTGTGGFNYRVQIFVNGYQFGKYVNNLGPQTAFPVPEGILNYSGHNTLALTLWALDDSGTKLGGIAVRPQTPVLSSYSKPAVVPMPGYVPRLGAY